MSKLTIKKLSKKFGSYQVNKDISFTAEKGEFVTLLGPSGCGKTTLLKMIAGFHYPDSGDILINDISVKNLPPEKRNTAMCFQSYALFPHLNVVHNIAFGLKQKKIPKEKQRQLVDEVLSQVGLESQRLKMPSELSGGQQQRVALARAMVTRPDVILFDEPLSNLDAKLRESVRFEIKELQRLYSLTSIYVTHDQAEALSISDKIVVLNAGKIEQIGTPEEIYYKPKNRFVADFIGIANIMEGEIINDNQDGSYNIKTFLGDFTIRSVDKPSHKHLYVCWRPEDIIHVPEEKSGNNYFSLKIEKMFFMGDHTKAISITNSGEQISLQLVKKTPFNIGETVCFFLPDTSLVFWEAVNE